MRSRKFTLSLFLSCVVAIPVTAFTIVTWIERNYVPLPVYQGENYTVTDFRLQNQHGTWTGLKDWKGKIVIADFFFTYCPLICPKMTQSLKAVQETFRSENDILLTSFSVDPARDSVKRLKHYAEKFSIAGNWYLLTGEKIEIYRLARKSFSVVATDGDGEANDFIHSEKLVLLDKQQRIRGYYSGTSEEEVARLITDIKKLKDEE